MQTAIATPTLISHIGKELLEILKASRFQKHFGNTGRNDGTYKNI
jgi:glucokinase